MSELASPRQRVWFRLRPGLSRDAALQQAAALLLAEKPDGAAILSLSLYEPGTGGDAEDRTVETFMWELQYEVDETRDWDWGHQANEALCAVLRKHLADPNYTG